VGLFSSRDRRDKTPVNSNRETATTDGPAADTLRTQPRSTDSASHSSKDSSDKTAGSSSAPSGTGNDRTGMSGTEPGAAHTGKSTRSEGEKRMATVGQSIVFKGELTGDEDLEIEGQVDGQVELSNHQITVGANGRVKAQVNAKSIIVIGQVIGDLTATERIEIQATGVVEGNLRTPRLNVQEGAVLNGSIDMSAPSTTDVKKPSAPGQQPGAGNAGSAGQGEALKSA
jgi:cytoskeletal protein CcmA (bactofilin family)